MRGHWSNSNYGKITNEIHPGVILFDLFFQPPSGNIENSLRWAASTLVVSGFGSSERSAMVYVCVPGGCHDTKEKRTPRNFHPRDVFLLCGKIGPRPVPLSVFVPLVLLRLLGAAERGVHR